ncbi:MAG TPA: AAA family ATPase [Streptosporangiaceae bacterium]
MLLEREAHLAALRDYAREAGGGEGRLVFIGGEAGIGKSALVEGLSGDLADACWYWSGCDGLFTPRPLGPLFDLAGQLGGELAGLCRDGAPRERLFGALLSQIGASGGLRVLVIEDVHWADEATIDLLRFLGRRIRTASVLLLVTYRDDALQPSDPLRLALGELASQRCTRRVSLAPLSAKAVAAMAGGSGLEPAELFELTGGNPFYLTEVLRSGAGRVPPSARDAVLARAARLGAGARAVLDVAALTGTRVEPGLLATVTGADSGQIDEVLGSGLLVADAIAGSLRFRHEIARLAIEQALAALRSVRLHAAILAGLEDLGCADDARMAFHAEAAGDAEAVLRYAPRAAARAAELAAHREAVAQFQRALRFAGQAGDAEAATLQDGLADELALIDRWEEAAQANELALARWRRAGDRLREGDTLRRLSRTMWRLCRGQESAEAGGVAVAVLQPLGPTPELAWALVNMAGQRMLDGRNDEARELAGQAAALATSLGETAVLCEALNTRGCAIEAVGGNGLGMLREAVRTAVGANLGGQAGRAFTNLYTCLSVRCQFAEADAVFADGIEFCEDRDISTYAACLRGERTAVLERTGRWAEAVQVATAMLARRGASPINLLSPRLIMGRIAARRGDEGAWAYLEAASVSAEGVAEQPLLAATRLARAEAHWLGGDGAAARELAESAADLADGCDLWQRATVGGWLRRTGSARRLSCELAGPGARAAAGDWAGAAREWDELGCRFDAAMARLESDDDDDLRAALAVLDDLGAGATARIARQRMRDRGVRSVPSGPRSTTKADPFGLTRREREVLELITEGCTNAQIAGRLFISVKTVDHHVSAVLAKLDVPTREAASRAVRNSLAGAPS